MRTVLAALTVLFLAAGPVSAANPEDRIGGTLSASPTEVTLLSQATVPATVVIATEGPFTVTPASFAIAPGQTVTMTVSGDPRGRVSATMTAVSPAIGADGASVTLQVTLAPYVAPFDWTPVGIACLLILSLLLAGRRWRPWQLRLARRA